MSVNADCLAGLEKHKNSDQKVPAGIAPEAPVASTESSTTKSAADISINFDARELVQETKSIVEASALPKKEVAGIFLQCVMDLTKSAPNSGNLYLARTCSCVVDPKRFNESNSDLNAADIKSNIFERENRCAAQALEDFKSDEKVMGKIKRSVISVCKSKKTILDLLGGDADNGCSCVFNDVRAKHSDALVRSAVLQHLSGIAPAFSEGVVACRKPGNIANYPFQGRWIPKSTGCKALEGTDLDDSIVFSGVKLINESGVCTANSISRVGNMFSTVEDCRSGKEKHIMKRRILLSDNSHLTLDPGTKFESKYVKCSSH